jgi:hypothetical protein
MTHSTPKRRKIQTHNSRHFSMKKKVVYRLPTTLVHTTPIYYYDVSLSQIIQIQDLSYCCRPPKECYSQRDLNSLNTFSMKWGTSRNGQHMIKRPYFKLSLFRGDSTYFILTTMSQSDRVQKIEGRSDKVTFQSCTAPVKDILH